MDNAELLNTRSFVATDNVEINVSVKLFNRT